MKLINFSENKLMLKCVVLLFFLFLSFCLLSTCIYVITMVFISMYHFKFANKAMYPLDIMGIYKISIIPIILFGVVAWLGARKSWVSMRNIQLEITTSKTQIPNKESLVRACNESMEQQRISLLRGTMPIPDEQTELLLKPIQNDDNQYNQNKSYKEGEVVEEAIIKINNMNP